jgi:hypothetical protein
MNIPPEAKKGFTLVLGVVAGLWVAGKILRWLP